MPKADPGRRVTPAKIAEGIAFFLSDATGAATGAAIAMTSRG
jgi:hypothetical protein